VIAGGVVLERFDEPVARDMPGDRQSLRVAKARAGTGSDRPPTGPAPADAAARPEQCGAGDVANETDGAGANDDAAEIAASRDALQALISGLTADAERALHEMMSGVAGAVQDAAAHLLPFVLDRGAAAEIAANVARLLVLADGLTPRIALHPDQHDPVVAQLALLDLERPVAVVSDPTIAKGTAQLTWENGGAAIDVTAALDVARLVLDARLDSLVAAASDNTTSDGADHE